MFCSLKILYRIGYLSTSTRPIGPEYVGCLSLILDEDSNVPRTCQLSTRGVQGLDLRSKLKPSTRNEADGHLQLPGFIALDLPEGNSLQDPLVDHILFGFEEHVRCKNESGRCSAPGLVRRHEQRESLLGTYGKRF